MHGGICINNHLDSLAWLYNQSLGMVKVNLMYDFIASSLVSDLPEDFLCRIWKLKIPLKIICFNWLYFRNKINTFDNLIKKGWSGPYWCSLCKLDFEYVEHLFQNCSFTQRIIGYIRDILAFPHFWRKSSFAHNISDWISRRCLLKHLPFFLSGTSGWPGTSASLRIRSLILHLLVSLSRINSYTILSNFSIISPGET